MATSFPRRTEPPASRQAPIYYSVDREGREKSMQEGGREVFTRAALLKINKLRSSYFHG